MKKEQGFTILELLIATIVFSILILVAITSFLTIGHLFYKGIALTQSQDAVRNIMADVTNGIQRAPGTALVPTGSIQVSSTQTCGSTSTGVCTYYCINGDRYTALTGPIPAGDTQTTAPTTLKDFSLIKDTASCNNPFSATGTPINNNPTSPTYTKPTELLGNGLWLRQFKILNPATDFYTIDLRIAYGNDLNNFINYSGNDYSGAKCQGGRAIGFAFCSTNSAFTSVIRGINNNY